MVALGLAKTSSKFRPFTLACAKKFYFKHSIRYSYSTTPNPATCHDAYWLKKKAYDNETKLFQYYKLGHSKGQWTRLILCQSPRLRAVRNLTLAHHWPTRKESLQSRFRLCISNISYSRTRGSSRETKPVQRPIVLTTMTLRNSLLVICGTRLLAFRNSFTIWRNTHPTVKYAIHKPHSINFPV
jgi:hypothetical protein